MKLQPDGDGGHILRLGVTGHRENRLDARAIALLQRKATTILSALARKCGPQRWVVSALADGTDLVVSELGAGLGYRLDVILPFDRQDYLQNFPDDARLRFDALLAQNSTARIQTAIPMKDRDTSYLQAGVQMLDRSDLLFANWDGKPARGPGGTAQVVEIARNRGLPVLWLDPEGQVRLAAGQEPWRDLPLDALIADAILDGA